MSLGEYLGAGAATTKLLLHLNGNSNDDSGNGNNGTDTAIVYGKQYGKFNEGALFNGSTSDITISNVDVDTTAFTIIIWRNLLNALAFRNIISKCTNNQAHPFDIYVVQNSRNVQFYLGNGTDGGSGSNLLGSNCVVFNKWQCWMFTLNSSKLASIYVDGKLVNSGIINKTIENGTTPVRLGIRQDGFVKAYGYADETIIENKVWTLQEYQKYYTTALGRFATI